MKKEISIEKDISVEFTLDSKEASNKNKNSNMNNIYAKERVS